MECTGCVNKFYNILVYQKFATVFFSKLSLFFVVKKMVFHSLKKGVHICASTIIWRLQV